MPWAELKFWGAKGRACPKAEPGRLPRVGIVFVLIIIDYLYNNKRMLYNLLYNVYNLSTVL